MRTKLEEKDETMRKKKAKGLRSVHKESILGSCRKRGGVLEARIHIIFWEGIEQRWPTLSFVFLLIFSKQYPHYL